MTEAPRPIVSLVLDTSAVIDGARGSMHVLEPLLLAAEDGHDVMVPALCLAEAARQDPSLDLLELLYQPQVVTGMPDRDVDGGLLELWTIVLDGRSDLAAAAVLARHFQAGLLTAEPKRYALGDPDSGYWIIPVDGSL